MRAVLFAALLGLLVGCGKGKDEVAAGGGDAPKPAEKGKDEKPAGKGDEANGPLPESTAELRVAAQVLYDHYRYPTGDEREKHPTEGQRAVIKTHSVECFGVQAGKQYFILEGSEDLFRRPKIVYVLKNARGWEKGQMALRDLFIEGVSRGPVEFTAKPWSKDWLKLTPQRKLPDKFLLVEDALIVAPPK